MKTRHPQSGFALVITLLLLGLLVLVVYCLSALSRVGTDISASGAYQVQARQHALLGLSQAIGGLQRYAAEDDALTGMAGVTGSEAGASAVVVPARQPAIRSVASRPADNRTGIRMGAIVPAAQASGIGRQLEPSRNSSGRKPRL